MDQTVKVFKNISIFVCRPTLKELELKSALVLQFGHPLIMDGIRPMAPNFVNVGMMNCRSVPVFNSDSLFSIFIKTHCSDSRQQNLMNGMYLTISGLGGNFQIISRNLWMNLGMMESSLSPLDQFSKPPTWHQNIRKF